MWQLDDDQVLDPTNADGVLEGELTYLFGLIKIDTTVARINEPPVGGDCNVYTRIDGSGVRVIAERDIFADGTLTCLIVSSLLAVRLRLFFWFYSALYPIRRSGPFCRIES